MICQQNKFFDAVSNYQLGSAKLCQEKQNTLMRK